MRYVLSVLLILFTPELVAAQGANFCGDPPPVANEDLKADLKGEAAIISRFFGDAQLSGMIERSKREIFSKYPDAEKSRSNAYLEYQLCVLLFSDDKMDTKTKIDELMRARQFINTSIPITEDVKADKNSYFHSQIASYSRSADGGSVLVTMRITGISDEIFYLAFVKDNYGIAIDNNGTSCRVSEQTGMPSDQCSGGSNRPSNFALFDKNTTSTINLIFRCAQSSLGSILNVSIPLCIRFHRNNVRTGITVGFSGLTM